jgi:hypothetical protein
MKERRENAIEEGKIGCGMLKGLVQEHMIYFPWLARNMVSHYMINYTDDNLLPLEIITGTNNQTVVSGLTAASPVGMATATATTTPTGTTPTQESDHIFLILRLPIFWLVVDLSNYLMISAHIFIGVYEHNHRGTYHIPCRNIIFASQGSHFLYCIFF